jgi:hypothetical protein
VPAACLEQMPEEISEMVAASRGLGSIRVPVCGVRRLAEQGFPGGTPEIARGDACAPPDLSPRHASNGDNASDVHYSTATRMISAT